MSMFDKLLIKNEQLRLLPRQVQYRAPQAPVYQL